MKVLSFLCLLVGLCACSTYSEDELAKFDRSISNYVNENELQCEKSESGLYFKIVEEGEGRDIQFNDRVSFSYHGEFLDGEVFDSREDTVTYEVSELITAWKEMMLQMKKGGEAVLIAPPQLAYGTHELEDIPANSILVFRMKIIDVE